MMNESEYQRWQAAPLRELLALRRGAVIVGARKTGKTTLARQIIGAGDIFRSLDDASLLAAALNDPAGFVAHSSGVMVIDEIQKAPILLGAIKHAVDRDNRAGQFLLTGSADLTALPAANESLAGRVGYLRLRPLTMGEILRRPPSFLARAFAGDFPPQLDGYPKAELIRLATRGGYPEVVRAPAKKRLWHRDYVAALLTRDLREVVNIRRHEMMRSVFRTLLAWSGKFMELSGVGGALAIAKPTLESYINALLALYLFEKVPPWTNSDYDRLGRRDKIYATDTGLLANILRWQPEALALDADRSGKLIETFVFNEIAAQIDLDDRYTLTHYYDREKREIDFMIEDDDGAIVGIEVKAGSVVSRQDFRHLLWFKHHLAGKRPFRGIVLYSGAVTVSFGENLTAAPLAALWDD